MTTKNDSFTEKHKKTMREIRLKQEEAQKVAEEVCSHMMGANALSEFQSAMLTSIIWHETLYGQPRTGICTNCGRKFVPSDTDYETWIKKPSGNKASGAGVEQPLTEEEKKQDHSNDTFSAFDEDAADWYEKQPAKKATPEEIRVWAEGLSDSELTRLFKAIKNLFRPIRF